MNRSPKRRQGAVLLLVFVCLIVLSTILGGMFQHLTISNRQIKQRNRKSQASLIAESAIGRAVASLRKDPSYRKETWRIDASELGNRYAANVDINVSLDDDPMKQVITVEATYPVESDFRVMVRKSVIVAKIDSVNQDPPGE